ncbi:MAG: glycosyltransferase family 2 protein, partial [Phycisphaerales bacterium]
AIKEGFEQGSGDLVAFLDADGTCDPNFFAELCAALIREEAAVAIGSRMGPRSKMPAVRRLGNRIYAFILSLLSNRPVPDTASGMRVIRREALARLYPLPDGLHFTPAMSARALTDERLKLVEIPMPYEERVGDSKLHVLRDGVRFLRTIFEMTLMWRPAKLFFFAAIVCLSLMTLLAMHPIEMWLRLGRLEEDMIYRLLFCALLGAFGVISMSAGLVSRLIHDLLDDKPRQLTFLGVVLDRFYSFTGLAAQAAVAVPMLLWLVGPGIWTRITEGHVYVHWSRVVLAGLIAFALGQTFFTILIANILRFHVGRRSTIIQPASRRRQAAASAALNIPIPPPHEPIELPEAQSTSP